MVLNTWSAPRYNGIRQAALTATPRIIEKLDTDGVRSPRAWFWQYANNSRASYRDSDNPLKRFFSPGLAALRILAAYGLMDRKIARAMSRMPALAAESPIAAERIRRFMRQYCNPIPKVVCIPHPVVEDYMHADASGPRENRIVSVGRWQAYQKNFPLLLDVLEKFLEIHPDWEADIIGQLPKGWQPGARFTEGTSGRRIHFHNYMAHREISSIYKKSKIFFLSSRYESFNIAAAEALCCGCSVVGPVDIASVPFFAGEASGTVACRQRRDHFLDALGAEVQAWETGQRNPERISQKWVATVGSVAVAKKFVECFESLPG
jgi:glycosyltransferase involved in cell wall biosynthesis